MKFDKPSILVIDDNESNLELMLQILDGLDINIITASSGQDGLKRALENNLCLIMLDVMMPVMNGFETAKLLSRNKRTSDIPIIFVTALEFENDDKFALQGYESGAVDIIYKPFQPKIIHCKVKVFMKMWQHQQELMGYKASLEALVEHRTKTLADTVNQLVSSNEIKNQFLSVINHELRTPLNGIEGTLYLLNETEPSEAQQELLLTGTHSLRQLTHLIETILLVSENDSNSITLYERPFSIRQSISRISEHFKTSAGLQNLCFDCTFHELVPDRLIGDPSVLNRILTLLLSNAFKFTYEGKVSLAIDIDKIDEKIVEINDNRVNTTFTITDTGVGIPASTLQIIEELFEHENNTFNRNFDGLGVGLSICQSLLTLINGEVTVESEINKGTTVTIKVPLEIASEDAITDDAAALEAAENEARNVLIVEDNMINVMVLKKVVEKCGHNVYVANNGKEALSLLDTTKIDIILMDCQMPIMDGYETTENIRATDQGFNNIPIIAVTANATTENRDYCLEVGMNDYLSKPLNFDKLRSKLDRWIH